MLAQEIHETIKYASANWFLLDAPIPFTRGDVLSNGSIHLMIHGRDAWLPKVLFLYGTRRPDAPTRLSIWFQSLNGTWVC